jgi:formamidopyrimidine-DNA glycosylase
MPELPEVETTRRGISPHVEGKVITNITVRNPKLRWPVPDDIKNQIVSEQIKSVQRRAKYLLLEIASGHLMIHLGMSGSLRIVDKGTPPSKHDHVDIEVENKLLRYNDPRRFGAVLWIDNLDDSSHLNHLGPEPLTDDFHADYLFTSSRKRQTSIKQHIMDNKVVVGVGNIYANESLFMAGIKPTMKASSLTHNQSELLSNSIKQVLARAIEQGGTTLKDFVGGDGKPGYFQQQLAVYGRANQPCVNCSSTLIEIKQQGRTSVYCPKCQRGR